MLKEKRHLRATCTDPGLPPSDCVESKSQLRLFTGERVSNASEEPGCGRLAEARRRRFEAGLERIHGNLY